MVENSGRVNFLHNMEAVNKIYEGRAAPASK